MALAGRPAALTIQATASSSSGDRSSSSRKARYKACTTPRKTTPKDRARAAAIACARRIMTDAGPAPRPRIPPN
eukprot:4671658-Pyramimonas_sp.AAC.1